MHVYPPHTLIRATVIAAAGTLAFFLVLMLCFTSGMKINPAFDAGNLQDMSTQDMNGIMNEMMIEMTGTEVLVHHLRNPGMILDQSGLLATVFVLIFLGSVSTARSIKNTGRMLS